MGIGLGILGAIVGGIFGSPTGAIIGGAFGACSGNGGREEPQQRQQRSNGYTAREPQNPVQLLFLCLGKIAMADGQLTDDEASFAVSAIQGFSNGDDVAASLIKQAFLNGCNSSRPFRLHARRLAQCLTDQKMRDSAMKFFCSMAMVDKELSEEEQSMLEEASQILHAQEAYQEFFRGNASEDSDERQQKEQNSSRAAEPAADELQASYELLGVSSSASDDEVKQAWRKKAMDFHPDRIQGMGLNASFIEFAKEQMQKINQAYETIQKCRGN